jgi:hypothetical protein
MCSDRKTPRLAHIPCNSDNCLARRLAPFSLTSNASDVASSAASQFEDWARNIYLNEVSWRCEFAKFTFHLYEQDKRGVSKSPQCGVTHTTSSAYGVKSSNDFG